MLLETFIYHHPDARLSSFDYRAVNALPVDNAVTIHGSWIDDNTAQLWMIKDTDGVVCMTGNIDTL
jgi:hydroxyacyl-ACP dehydratase HTD2-like protein with hotdog domain